MLCLIIHSCQRPHGPLISQHLRSSTLRDFFLTSDKILERGEKLSLLAAKTDELVAKSETFKSSANALKNKMFWKSLT